MTRVCVEVQQQETDCGFSCTMSGSSLSFTNRHCQGVAVNIELSVLIQILFPVSFRSYSPAAVAQGAGRGHATFFYCARWARCVPLQLSVCLLLAHCR